MENDRVPSENRRPRSFRGSAVKRSALLAAAAVAAAGATLGVSAIADASSAATKTTAITRPALNRTFHRGFGFGGPGGWARGSHPGAFGMVKSVTGSGFTLTTPGSATVTVEVSRATTYRDPGKATASLSDVTVGEHVAVAGTDTSNTIAATDVVIVPAGSARRGFGFGFGEPGGWARGSGFGCRTGAGPGADARG